MNYENLLRYFNLQLFAGEGTGDGGSGGDGADTGVGSADPGHQRLLELGVPKSKLPKKKVAYQNATATKTETADQAQEQKPDEGHTHDAENNSPTEEGSEQKPKRLTWEEIKNDPEYKAEYDKETSSLVRSRLRSAKTAEENMAKLMPALEVLARNMGMDMENIDYGALAEKINQDKSYYEDMALQKGDSVEKFMKDDQDSRASRREQKAQQQSEEDAAFESHMNALVEQGKEVKKLFPSFDLREELKNPAFARMTMPGVGIMSVEDAYRAVHRKEIEAAAAQVTAQMTAQQISNSIQSGSRRPQENGTTGVAPSVTTFDYAKASREEKARHDAWVKAELAAGRKPRPGDYPG